jgi:hypothetical protein
VDGAFEFPVITDEFVSGRIGERLRHRIAGSPHLHFAIVDGVAEEEYPGRRIGGVNVGASIG